MKASRKSDAPVCESRWKKESAEARDSLGLGLAFAGWTERPSFAGEGVSLTPRVLDLLNVTAAKILLKEGKDKLLHTFLDVSQSLSRNAFTRPCGLVPCITTSTEMYSYAQDRVVLPEELLGMHGVITARFAVPDNLPPRELKNMAGGCLSCPCLGSVMWSWHVMRARRFDLNFLKKLQ